MTQAKADTSRTRFWLLPLLPLLLWLIGTIGQDLYTWISEDFFGSLSATIPYKRLLQISLLLLCSIVALVIHYRQKIRSLSSGNTSPSQPQKKEVQAEQIETLQHLSTDEKELLRQHFAQDKTCLKHPEKGAALSLDSKGILYVPSQHYDPVPMGYDIYFEYCVSEWAWVHLKKHPKLLD